MTGRWAPLLALGPEEQEALEKIVRSRKAEARLVQRARLLLEAARNSVLAEAARGSGVSCKTAKTWIRRFRERALPMEERLADEPRSGAPPRFSAEALCQIVALGCKQPQEVGRPISHWTPRELAEEAVQQGIVESISPRHVGRFLKRCGRQATSDALLDDAA